MKKFTSSDVWILHTIAYASAHKPASLQDIITVGDFLEHAIFNYGELQNGLHNLFQAGYISQVDKCYVLTEFGKNKLIHIKKRTVMSERDEISKKLGVSSRTPPQSSPEYDPLLNPVFFTISEFKIAYKKYMKNLGETQKIETKISRQ
jgi:hypothetical protein